MILSAPARTHPTKPPSMPGRPRSRSGWGPVLILLGLLGCHGPATASTSCSATMTDVAFGTVDPHGGNVDVQATINYSCTITSILSSSRVRMCFSIGVGSSGLGHLTPRRMISGANAMAFQLYKDAGRSLIWATRFNSEGSVGVDLEVGALLGSATNSGSLTVYGRVPAGQSTLVPGSYSNTFGGAHTELVYQYNEFLLGLLGFPASCTGGGNGSGASTFPFVASAGVQKQCSPAFATPSIDFGTQGLLRTPVATTTILSPRCTNTTPYQIGLDNGQHASGNTRRMQSATDDHVSYELYRDASHSLRWGNTQNVDTVSGTGTGAAQDLTVHGRISEQTTPAAGSYSDTVTVTIYY